MDDLDHKLLSQLRGDARRPAAALAKELGISRATVRARINRLIETGVISGFTIMVREHDRPSLIRAVMMIEVEGRTTDKVLK